MFFIYKKLICMKKNILIILAHPAKKSLCESIANEYYQKLLNEKNTVKLIKLKDLKFDLNLYEGYSEEQLLEKDLQKIQKDILWANHLVFVFPTWWGTYPALLKGFVDRVFLPGFAYKFHKGSIFQEKLLKGKSAHLITTMNSPSWFYNFYYFASGVRSLKTAVLEFCGVSPVKVTIIDNARKLKPEDFKKIKIFNK